MTPEEIAPSRLCPAGSGGNPAGISYTDIARQFAAEGIESATGAITWTSSGIRTMLTTNAQRKSVASSRPTTAQAPLG